jgi:hypothetical protein
MERLTREPTSIFGFRSMRSHASADGVLRATGPGADGVKISRSLRRQSSSGSRRQRRHKHASLNGPPLLPWMVRNPRTVRCRPGVPCVLPAARHGTGRCLWPCSYAAPCLGRVASFLTHGCLQAIQGSSGKPSKEAVVCRRCRHGQ